MNRTERFEEPYIEASIHHPDTRAYKMARIAILNTEMSEIQVQMRALTEQHEALWAERYQLECEVARQAL